MLNYAIRMALVAILAAGPACASQTAGRLTADGPMPTGTWTRELSRDGKTLTEVLVFVDGYFSITTHEAGNGAFVMTKGGSFSKTGADLQLLYEFHSADAAQVGKSETWKVAPRGKALDLSMGGQTSSWQALESGQSTPLTGAWLMSGRERNGEIQRRDTSQPRKTMKLLTGTRFQWIAYNTATGEFFGSGGGEYTAKDGAYVEMIRFFSRDNNRVGANLPFDFRMESGNWHHMGKSSAGEPMHEVWSKRQ